MTEKAGWIVIGTKVDNKQLTKDLNEQKRLLKNYEKEASELLELKEQYETNIQAHEKEYNAVEKVRKELKAIKKEYDDIEGKIKEIYEPVDEGEIRKRLEANPGIIKQRNEILAQYEAKKNELYSLKNPLYSGENAEIEEQKKLLDEVNKKLKENVSVQNQISDNINKITTQAKLQNITTEINKIGKGLTATIKKVVRWGLAIFGIRGAYMAVRNAISVISQEDEQLKADINYVKTALAYALEPVVRAIVNLVKELLYAVQNIIYFLTGKNIFANANKALDSANKKAQKLSKTLAGFDEMNVLNDSSGSSSTTPSMNLGEINELSETGKGLVGIITAIAGAITLMNLSKLLNTLGLINGELTTMQGLGIFGIILSLYNIIEDLINIWNKFDETVEGNNTTLKDWGDVVMWIGVGIASLGLLLGSLPAIVVGTIVAIIAVIMKYWDEIKKFFTDKVFGWMEQKIQDLQKTTFGKFIAEIIRDSRGAIKEILNILDGMFIRFKNIFDGIVMIFKGNVAEGLKSIFKGTINTIISGLNFLIYTLNLMLTPLRGLIVAFGKVTGKNWTMENIRLPQLPYLAKGGIVNMPGRGVPVGSAMTGENGQEGVIPLTDSQQMALLGEAIGKYININATVPVYVGNRMVAREIKRINAEDNFAYNR